ncbi:nuclear transport factor 2 family protein [Nonomuraea sp. NPDC050783]|uniref:nuclear transport factor 2 family protein n=1 Tax=Nonomuraea sp. NPDC050783 TaxID=3154634 RepID=UPI003466ED58
MTPRKKTTLVVCAALCVLMTGCSHKPAQPSPTASPTKERTTATGSVPGHHRALVEKFVAAINAGDKSATRDTFDPAARFDSVGRIYQGVEDIMSRFLVPEVIEAGGRYELLSLTASPGERVVAEYDFSTAGGGRERFTYDCAVRAGRFHDCVGRYV